MFVATLVGSPSLGQGEIAAAHDALAAAGCVPGAMRWIDEDIAADIPFASDPLAARAAIPPAQTGFDVIIQPEATRAKRLLVADMDSTMITVECIDELADYAGIKAQIAEVTERAMRGELDFAEALHGRVALLAGLDEAMIDRCREERVRLMGGAKALIQTMRARGARTVLVSGGFTRFADPVAAEIGFDRAVANVLEIADGQLTGKVGTPIVDAARKQQELEAAIAELGIDTALSMAVGDGANDIPMIRAAGLGVAYYAKEKTRAAAHAEVVHGDLSVLLYAQGIPSAEWVAE
jgi:phosphoserine phosphatase